MCVCVCVCVRMNAYVCEVLKCIKSHEEETREEKNHGMSDECYLGVCKVWPTPQAGGGWGGA